MKLLFNPDGQWLQTVAKYSETCTWLPIVKDVGMRNEAYPESVRPVVRPVIHLSIRLVMVCLLRRGGENSGVQMRRMLKPDLDSESV
jgi:hypothetical protein